MHEWNAIMTIAYRDLLKFLRDRRRIFAAFIAPLILITGVGGAMQAADGGKGTGYSLLPFIFTGVLAQILFQSTGLGIVSLLDDRENDFSQEIFVSPISRYSIVFGKILGESLVSLAQGLVVIVLAFVSGLPLTPVGALTLLPAAIIVCLQGGAFGLLTLSLLGNQRTANQILPILLLPQILLAGIFFPVKHLPMHLDVVANFIPLRYAVDFMRNGFYLGRADYGTVVIFGPLLNGAAILGMFVVFLIIGTALFVRSERNR